MTAPRYRVGDLVVAVWSDGKRVDAVVVEAHTHGGNGRRLAEPYYRVTVAGVGDSRRLAFGEHELEPREATR